jgi:hypothetical protein
MVSRKKSSIVLESPESYFHGLVTETLNNFSITRRPETEWYLVQLMNRFVFAQNLYAQDADGTFKDEPLTFLLKDALEAESPESKRTMLQHVGDVSLYRAGFFQENLQRKSIAVDFYIGVGGSAYFRLSQEEEQEARKPIFLELYEKFPVFVSAIREISVATSPTKTDQDLFRMIELWNTTHSPRAEKALRKAGIDLPELPKKKVTQ